MADILADWSTASEGALYERIAFAMKAAIERGEITPGTHLPPERTLAGQLAVSRKTVLSAFELLKAEGWLVSRQGSGTWVTLPAGRSLTMGAVDSLASLSGILHAASDSVINMTSGQLEATPYVRDILGALQGEDVDRILTSQRPAPLGLDELRAVISHRMNAMGVRTQSSNVIVTTGTQQALSLLAAHYIRPGNLVLVEAATSLGALDAFRAVGAQVETIPTPDPGREIDQLLQLASDRQPSLMYLIPTYNNVTGSVMSSFERRRLARFAEETSTPLIEDLSHAGVGFDAPPPPLASFSKTADISVIDSMSKRYWSGLRVGWIVAPSNASGPLSRAKTVADLGTPQLSQLVALRLLEMEAEVNAERLSTVRERLSALGDGLKEQLPDWAWEAPAGGLSLWVQLPDTDARQFAQFALRAGVAVLPGPLLSASGSFADHIRISFHLPVSDLQEGIRRLAQAWKSYRAVNADH